MPSVLRDEADRGQVVAQDPDAALGDAAACRQHRGRRRRFPERAEQSRSRSRREAPRFADRRASVSNTAAGFGSDMTCSQGREVRVVEGSQSRESQGRSNREVPFRATTARGARGLPRPAPPTSSGAVTTSPSERRRALAQPALRCRGRPAAIGQPGMVALQQLLRLAERTLGLFRRGPAVRAANLDEMARAEDPRQIVSRVWQRSADALETDRGQHALQIGAGFSFSDCSTREAIVMRGLERHVVIAR